MGLTENVDVANETINWQRCIFVDAQLDDALLVKLTPRILELRQISSDPITVSINSVGGSLRVLDSLMGLLTGPDQDGNTCQIVTVATHMAYSAAATLLSMGNYAVALPHSDILVHDVRYGGLDDVTPSRALDAAKKLQSSNEDASLRLAERMFARWMWNYLDLVEHFSEDTKRFQSTADRFRESIGACNLPSSPAFKFDLAGFAVSVFARLSRANEHVIERAVSHLQRWGAVTTLAENLPRYSSAGNAFPGLLDGALALFRNLSKETDVPFGDRGVEDDLTRFLMLTVSRVVNQSGTKRAVAFENAVSDFSLLKSIDDPKHLHRTTRLVLRHKHVFFDADTLEFNFEVQHPADGGRLPPVF